MSTLRQTCILHLQLENIVTGTTLPKHSISKPSRLFCTCPQAGNSDCYFVDRNPSISSFAAHLDLCSPLQLMHLRELQSQALLHSLAHGFRMQASNESPWQGNQQFPLLQSSCRAHAILLGVISAVQVSGLTTCRIILQQWEALLSISEASCCFREAS